MIKIKYKHVYLEILLIKYNKGGRVCQNLKFTLNQYIMKVCVLRLSYKEYYEITKQNLF